MPAEELAEKSIGKTAFALRTEFFLFAKDPLSKSETGLRKIPAQRRGNTAVPVLSPISTFEPKALSSSGNASIPREERPFLHSLNLMGQS